MRKLFCGSQKEVESKLPVVEIFYSIQGEGYWAGRAATFIRLAGCNLSCEFCDTDYVKRESLELGEITVRVRKSARFQDFVVITGGEPTVHKFKFADLVNVLQAMGFYVAVETNGTLPLLCQPNWITVSPKTPREDMGVLYGVCRVNELKVLWETFTAEEFIAWEGFPADHYFVQPIERGGKFTCLTEIVEFVKKRPRWRVSLQLHKVLGVR